MFNFKQDMKNIKKIYNKKNLMSFFSDTVSRLMNSFNYSACYIKSSGSEKKAIFFS